jgi:uncharacterized membrane protein
MSGGIALSTEAATLVGAVLVEAIALYVGYGTVERIVGPTILETVTGN